MTSLSVAFETQRYGGVWRWVYRENCKFLRN